ncbi:MAG: hypothetical protein ACJ0RA_01710 [Candidatus Neomarinimicrobiota bacterium]
MEQKEELEETKKELADAEEEAKAYETLMANSMKSGDTVGDLSPEEELEIQKDLNKAEEEQEDLENALKEKEKEKQELEMQLAGMQQEFGTDKVQDVLDQKDKEIQDLAEQR